MKNFPVPACYTRRGNAVTRSLGRLAMQISGWCFEGRLPDLPKVVITVAPHTSNWDFIVGVMALWALDIKITFIGKHTLFRGLFGRWLRSIGGIPVDRSAPHGVVGELVKAFELSDKMVLALAPEGTRRLDKGFKTGFLFIALGAKVPIVPAYFDFSRKIVGFGTHYMPIGDISHDLNHMLDFYRSIKGRYVKDWQRDVSSNTVK